MMNLFRAAHKTRLVTEMPTDVCFHDRWKPAKASCNKMNKMKRFIPRLHLRRHCCDANIIGYAQAVICHNCNVKCFKKNGFFCKRRVNFMVAVWQRCRTQCDMWRRAGNFADWIFQGYLKSDVHTRVNTK